MTISKIAIPIVVLCLCLISGCMTNTGDVIVKEKILSDFTCVSIGEGFEVEVIQSESFSIVVSADSSLYRYILISREGEILSIYISPRYPQYRSVLRGFFQKEKALRVSIRMPDLRTLSLSGASRGTVEGFQPSEFNLYLTGASSLDGNINAGDANLRMSEASRVRLKGSANRLILFAAGRSNAELTYFPVKDANVNLSALSEATINVRGKLDCFLTDMSNLYYSGNPTMGNIEVYAGSAIKPSGRRYLPW
ncbi:head GIN domain-containing protein [Chloroflexota bacterium]